MFPSSIDQRQFFLWILAFAEQFNMPLSRQQNFPQLDFKANRGRKSPPSFPTI